MVATQYSLPPNVSIRHGVKGFAGDITGEDSLGLLCDALVKCHIKKPAPRPLFSILDQGRCLPSAWGSQKERK